ncbi:hypothetical protein EC950183_2050, partial [Escherichia coli 95.0183]
MYESLLLLAC